MTGDLSRMVDDVQRRLSEGADEVRRYLASPEGRQLRQRVAQGLIFAAPFVFRFGPFKASRMGRLLGVLGGTAVVIKLAEALRDWDPVAAGQPVEDVRS